MPLNSSIDSAELVRKPLIIPRSEHTISRKQIDREALKVLYRLRDEGYIAYLVGGGVRDILLGKVPKDFDISTNAKPAQIRKIFRNSRIIGRRFQLVQVFFGGGKIVEVSTFRCQSEFEVDGEDAVLPSNNIFGDSAEDAFRRDLTINALFYEIETFTVIDHVGGVKDLNDKIVRLIGDPQRRIIRDPVRMMRVIRHAARASFEIDPETFVAICQHRDKLLLCPVSRIRDELFKDLSGGACRRWAELAIASGLFFVIFPFCKKVMADGPDAQKHCKFLYDMLDVVNRLVVEGRVVPEDLILSALFLPWALSEPDLMAVKTQKDSYLLSRRLRDSFAEALSYLNVKRSLLDSVSRGIATLPLIVNLKDGKVWPKWLKKKSYFEDGLLLYQMYNEAIGAKTLPSSELKLKADEDRSEPTFIKKSFARSGGPRGVAFAPSTVGGVFGFRKK
nr:poly(A) polymerase [Desulfobulbaceae bacterium]